MKFHKCIPPIFSSFRYKLLLAFLIATMVPLISLTFISYHISYNIARDRIIDSAVMTDKQLVSQLNDRLGINPHSISSIYMFFCSPISSVQKKACTSFPQMSFLHMVWIKILFPVQAFPLSGYRFPICLCLKYCPQKNHLPM